MTPKEIKDGMTQGEWVANPNGTVIAEITKGKNIATFNSNTFDGRDYDQLAAISAVNATFNKGYNPEAMEDCVKALDDITHFTQNSIEAIENGKELTPSEINFLKAALIQARLALTKSKL